MPTPWRQALPAFALVLLATVLLYRDTFSAMVGIWSRSDTFAHAFLVPPIALWLAWRRRHLVAALTPQPQGWLLLPMATVAVAWLLGDLAGVNSVTQLMATALLVLAVPAVLGPAVARELSFPLAFLFFMVPIGEFLMPTLMDWTADFTVAALSLSGVPVYREGRQFIIPSGAWSVVEACSGVRYLIASFMVGTLFAYLNYSSLKRRLIFCALALLVPVLANWFRAYLIVMLGHLSDNKLAAGVDHLIYGWLFFGVVILLMFFIGSRWSEPGAGDPEAPAAGMASPASRPAAYWLVAGVAALLVGLPQAALWRLQHQPLAGPPVLALPALAGVAADDGAALLKPLFQGPAAEASRTYGSGAEAVTVHVAYYRAQNYGHKLVSSENMLVKSDSRDWNQITSTRHDIAVGPQILSLGGAELLGGGRPGQSVRQRLDVRQTYWVDGRFTANDHAATAYGVLGRLAGRGDDAAALVFVTEGEDSAATAQRLDAFIQRHLGAIEAQLAQARARR
jgi:exosortase A